MSDISYRSLARLQYRQFVEIPPLAVILVCASFLVPDFLLKLFILHDNTVMDAFLKTRPVPQERWDHELESYFLSAVQ